MSELDLKNIYEIGQSLKEKLVEEEALFSGEKLVDWFIQNEAQVQTREEAVKLGRHFIEYRVIQHEHDKYHFIDEPNKIYRFCCQSHNIHPRSVSERQTWVQGLQVMRRFVQEQGAGRKRRKSLMNLLSMGQQNTDHTFKGKHLIEWLEKKTDFENREDCKRFFRSLLKLNFIRSSQNELRINESGEYWFYLTKLKDEVPAKMRKISKAIPEQKCSTVSGQEVTHNSLTRQQSVIGLTPGLIRQLAVHQNRNCKQVERIKLKETCGVLKNSINRSSQCLSQSRCSLVSSQSSSLGDRGSLKSRTSNDSDQENCPRSSYIDVAADSSYIARLRAQYAASNSRPRLTQSECGSISDLIESKDFQKQLQNIGKSSSQKNLKQVEVSRREILAQIQDIKYGRSAGPISPSSSCPQNLNRTSSTSSCRKNLDLYLKRDYSTESRATRSSGYGSLRNQSYDLCSSSDSLFEEECPTPTTLQCGTHDTPTFSITTRLSDTPTFSITTRLSDASSSTASPPAEGPQHYSPVPPPRSSLKVPCLSPDGRLQDSVERSLRVMMSHPDDVMMSHPDDVLMSHQRTATSARRARLVRARAVSEGDAN